jgi:hypothetical protein
MNAMARLLDPPGIANPLMNFPKHHNGFCSPDPRNPGQQIRIQLECGFRALERRSHL